MNYCQIEYVYGKNGVVTGDGSIIQPNNTFIDLPNQLFSQIQQAYNNMEPVIAPNRANLYSDRQNLYIIPAKSDGTPLLDTSNMTNMGWMFNNCRNLISVPLLNTSNATTICQMFGECTNLISVPLFDTHSVTDMTGVFDGCPNLLAIPSFDTSNVTDISCMFRECRTITSVPQFNTSKVTRVNSTFSGCTNLITVPQLDISNATDVYGTFKDCPNLSDESLNNILAMYANVAKITSSSNKTLKYIGLTSEQANRCKTLSNYSVFTSAGWSTGY